MINKKIAIATLFLCASQFIFAIETFSKEFNITKDKVATIKIDEKNITVTIDNSTFNLKNIFKNEEMQDVLDSIDKEDLIVIGDYNFDGYNDIGIATSLGYKGINLYRNYYFYKPKDNRFYNYLSNIPTLKIDKNRLVSHSRSSSFFYTTEYKIDNNKPYKSLKKSTIGDITMIEEFDKKGDITKKSFEPKYMTIKTDKAYLYNQPNKKEKTEDYLKKGDKVKILDIDNSYTWIKIEYKEKDKNYQKWIEYLTVI